MRTVEEIETLANDMGHTFNIAGEIHFNVVSGEWPDFVVNIETPVGPRNKEDFVEAITMFFFLHAEHALKEEEDAIKFYRLLSKYLRNDNVPYTPMNAGISSDKLDVQMYGIIPVPHKIIDDLPVLWPGYCEIHFKNRLIPASDREAIVFDETESVANFAACLTTLLIEPRKIKQKNK